jgi:diacylglycerol kinase
MKNKPFVERLSFSLQGIRSAWRHEASFRFQGVMALGVVALLVALRPEPVW